jgi:hypothetical protein
MTNGWLRDEATGVYHSSESHLSQLRRCVANEVPDDLGRRRRFGSVDTPVDAQRALQ